MPRARLARAPARSTRTREHSMSRRSTSRPGSLAALLLAAAALVACSQGHGDASTSGTAASSSGEVAPAATAAATTAAGASTPTRAPNKLGRIPVLEYHVIGGTKNALYTRTRESFRQDLEDVYRR